MVGDTRGMITERYQRVRPPQALPPAKNTEYYGVVVHVPVVGVSRPNFERGQKVLVGEIVKRTGRNLIAIKQIFLVCKTQSRLKNQKRFSKDVL